MPIVDLQIRMRELGRIRTGNQVVAGNGRRRPNKLDTFRLTTASRPLIEAAQEMYGGEIAPWESPAGKEWELIIQAPSLPIVIPPGQQLSQWYEMWTAAGCTRRCDGETNVITDGPCECPSDPAERRELASANPPAACKPTTRLSVILPGLPDLGMWRLESHGYYAAVELAGAAQFLAIASARGMNIPASLRLEQREKRIPGKPTNRYAVPVIEFTTTRIADLLAAGSAAAELPLLGEPTGAPQLAPGSLAPAKVSRAKAPRGERPDLGPAPVAPSGNGFGKPVAAAPAPVVAPTPSVGGWPVEDAVSVDVDAPGFLERLRTNADASGLKGPAQKPVRSALTALFATLDWETEIQPVLTAAFGPESATALTAAQGQAIVSLAASMGDDSFLQAWADLTPAAVTA